MEQLFKEVRARFVQTNEIHHLIDKFAMNPMVHVLQNIAFPFRSGDILIQSRGNLKRITRLMRAS